MTKKSKIALIIFVVILTLAVIALSVTLGIIEHRRQTANTRLNGIYEKSYFETLDCMNDVELKLSKITALSGSELKRDLLNDVWRECDLSATNFSQLGTENEDIDSIIKFFNQLGDYCAYLSAKLKNSPLTEEEETNLVKYRDIVRSLNTQLYAAQSSLIDGKNVKLITADVVSDALKTNSSVEYPEMIYDGPFSDGLNDREALFLKDKEEISSDVGLEKVKGYFPSASDIKYVGEGTSSIPSYLYEFTLGRNTGTAQITKTGGYLAMYNAYCEITEPALSEDECVAKADEYMVNFGYSNMRAVWVSNDDSTVYINYAFVSDGVIYYPDLVKIKICSQTGDLIGLEAQNYLYNHKERETAEFPEKEVTLSEKLTVKERNKCVIPTEWNTEREGVEIIAEKDGMTFYIYLDPKTGEELKVLVVIEEAGKLLI